MSDNNINLLINATNQANMYKTKNNNTTQINSIFIFVDPYQLESLELEDLTIEINVDDKGNFIIDNEEFKPIELKKGIKVLGLTK
ncbi:hypothetical protein [Alkaliphilus peptidifermentans]|uniref:Uncharacterized protein n=1 Tax=Alkaliphilus peptidifermentans DSM 18978 TaxID=1120976 RepID=A0A1G5GFY3_9FIRM|nr:hypothetical protein [Alkaliphilus peptidifermentans]SCY50257.1 hypothetical protein SAMN03080606_01670 [Alkaliphilus peptidifermentans DSM 18978]